MKPRKKKLEVSLFPFLSILACVIGVLVLMICLVVLSQIDDSGVEDTRKKMREHQASMDQFQAAKAKLLDLETRLEARQDELLQVKNTPVDVPAMRSERDALVNALAAIKMPAPVSIAPLNAKLETLKGQIAEGRKSLQSVTEALAERQKGPAGPTVRIRPSGSAKKGQIDPTFVECRAAEVVVHRAGGKMNVPRGNVPTDPDWIAVLKEVAKNPRRTVVFLIREDGISTYRLASRIAADHYARNGKLPVSGNGPLDFSAFGK